MNDGDLDRERKGFEIIAALEKYGCPYGGYFYCEKLGLCHIFHDKQGAWDFDFIVLNDISDAEYYIQTGKRKEKG